LGTIRVTKRLLPRSGLTNEPWISSLNTTTSLIFFCSSNDLNWLYGSSAISVLRITDCTANSASIASTT
jgi:hypothetical protein